MTAALGISAFYHDSAACLVADGDIVAAVQEERFTRGSTTRDFRHMPSTTVWRKAGCGSATWTTWPSTTSRW